MRACLVLAALIGLLTALSGAMADEIHPNLDAEAILAQQQAIRAEVESMRGRFKTMEPMQRESLFANQDKVNKLLTGRKLTTELNEWDQIEVFNALEAISAILNDAEDARMVCERVKPTGSNRPLTLCKTVAERRAEREAGVRQMTECLRDDTGNCK